MGSFWGGEAEKFGGMVFNSIVKSREVLIALSIGRKMAENTKWIVEKMGREDSCQWQSRIWKGRDSGVDTRRERFDQRVGCVGVKIQRVGCCLIVGEGFCS